MIPIPVPISGSNKRLFIPLLYLLVTASICYLFLVAFVGKQHDHQQFAPINKDTLVDTLPDLRVQRRSLTSLRTNKTSSRKSDSGIQEKNLQNNGARRSHPSKVWTGHQDDHWVDELAAVHYLWPNDDQCHQYAVHFAKKKTFKPRALVSFPGSGNSWLRYLIECSTGIFTGSVYADQSLFRAGLLGELRHPNDGTTILQKTHHDTTFRTSDRSRQAYVKLTQLMFGYRGLLLIRNPFNALISYWNFLSTRDHKGYADNFHFNDTRWIKFVKEEVVKWSSLVTSWVDNSPDLLLVLYEHLQNDPRSELTRILMYLDQPVDSRRLNCCLSHKEGPFHRNHENEVINCVDGSGRNEFISHSSLNTCPRLAFSYQNLDLIVQDNIDQINLFFQQKRLPVHLNYTMTTATTTMSQPPPSQKIPQRHPSTKFNQNEKPPD